MSGRPDINTEGYRALAARTTDAWLASTLIGFCDEVDDLRERVSRKPPLGLAIAMWAVAVVLLYVVLVVAPSSWFAP